MPLLFVALGLFGIVAALFGPVKYAMLPDQLVGRRACNRQRAGRRRDLHGDPDRHHRRRPVRRRLHPYGLVSIRRRRAGADVLGLCLAHSDERRRPRPIFPSPPIPGPRRSHLLKTLYAEQRLWDGMVIVSWFWLVGAVVLSLLPALVKDVVGGSEGVVTLCLAVFAIGIAVGSLFAAQLSHVRPNLALVPIGAIVMGIVGLDLAWAIGRPRSGQRHSAAVVSRPRSRALRMLIDFAVFAFGGGLFVVPSFAAVQAWSAPSERARVIAAGNVLQAAFMVVGSLFVAAAAGRRPADRLDLLRPCGRKLRRGLVRADQMGQGRRARFRLAAVPRAVPRSRCAGLKTCRPPARAC